MDPMGFVPGRKQSVGPTGPVEHDGIHVLLNDCVHLVNSTGTSSGHLEHKMKFGSQLYVN